MKIGIIGHGFVGNAIHTNLENMGLYCAVYDKYLQEFSCPKEIFSTTFCFVCVPTPHSVDGGYDLSALDDVFSLLKDYTGIVIIKCTLEPGTTQRYADLYINLQILHNPEFLSARTAVQDFGSQRQIVLGRTRSFKNENLELVCAFYSKYFPDSMISVCDSTESECMKIFCNSFYASKIQIFTEFKLLCDRLGCNFNDVKQMMINNGWINPMHTNVPGNDGKISYGGLCLTKDTRSLSDLLKRIGSPCEVLNAVATERDTMRSD